jgi:hydroxymethylpyrimidine pyrophosphatase-like HAD family hydrolase
MAGKAMVITDLDGTLFQKDHRISKRNYQTLLELGASHIVRVVATGRSLYSAHRILSPGFPIDFLVFSSGAGIMAWSGQEILFSASMNGQEVSLAFDALKRRSLDFMVHRPIPENHHFLYFSSGEPNPDFEARCRLYRDFATPGGNGPPEEACQLVAIEPYFRSTSRYSEIREELSRLSVVRTTSPLDGKSGWIEIFSGSVSKAQAAVRLARRLAIREEAVLAIGNDYNDLDLLGWAARSFVVAQAPQELLTRFPAVRSEDESDFSEAVALWRRARAS